MIEKKGLKGNLAIDKIMHFRVQERILKLQHVIDSYTVRLFFTARGIGLTSNSDSTFWLDSPLLDPRQLPINKNSSFIYIPFVDL